MTEALIAIHAAAGVLAAAAGVRALTGGPGIDVYLVSLLACIAFVAAAVAVDWGGLDGGTQALFAALLALGCYMIFRAARARRRLAGERARPSVADADDIGFTVVALLDAFAVIAVIDLGASGYVAGAVAVLGALAGHRTLGRYKRRLRDTPRGGVRLP